MLDLGFLEAVLGQNRLRRRRLQVADEALRFGRVAAALDGGDRIQHGGVQRHVQHHVDLVFHDGRVGGVDEARIDFAARHVVERLAHVLRADGFRLHGVPQLGLLQRAFGVTADGHAGRVGDGHAGHALVRQVAQALDAQLAIVRHDQHQAVADEVHAVGRQDEALLLRRIHGFLVGRGKHVHRRALDDLLQQHARGGEVQGHLAARILRLIALRRILERIRQAGRGRHHHFAGNGGGGGGGQQSGAKQAGEGGEAHDRILVK